MLITSAWIEIIIKSVLNVSWGIIFKVVLWFV